MNPQLYQKLMEVVMGSGLSDPVIVETLKAVSEDVVGIEAEYRGE